MGMAAAPAVSPSRDVAGAVATAAARGLRGLDRERYTEEFAAELYDLRHGPKSRRRRAAYVVRLVFRLPAIRLACRHVRKAQA